MVSYLNGTFLVAEHTNQSAFVLFPRQMSQPYRHDLSIPENTQAQSWLASFPNHVILHETMAVPGNDPRALGLRFTEPHKICNVLA